MDEKNQILGQIKWFDQEKGFGVITGMGDKEYFLRRNEINDSQFKYSEGKVVVFKPQLDTKRNRLQATDCNLFTKLENWNTLIDQIISNKAERNLEDEGIPDFPILVKDAAIQFAKNYPIQVLIQCLKEGYIKLKGNIELTSFIGFAELIIFKSYSGSDVKSSYSELTDLYLANMNIEILFESWEEKKLFTFWENSHRKEIVISYLNSIESKLTEKEKFDLFIRGFFPNASISTIERHIFSLPSEIIIQIIKSRYFSNEIAVLLFPQLINQFPALGTLIIDQSKEIFSESVYANFENNLYNKLESDIFLQLWFVDKIQHFNPKFLDSALKENKSYHDKLIALTIEEKFSSEEVKKVLVKNLQSIQDPETLVEFKTLENSLISLNKLDTDLASISHFTKSKVLNMLLWVYLDIEGLDFEILASKFIFFSPLKQVEVIKKLFFLKATDQFDLTIEKLSSLTKFDFDLYTEASKQTPEFQIDISTDLLIKLLESMRNKGDFFLETDIISLVLNDLYIEKTRKFKIEHYFEKCRGRMEAQKTESNGSIEKKPYKDKFYFEVHIEEKENRWKMDPDENRSFSKILDRVKAMEGSKYNSSGRFWGIPGKNEEDVIEMALEYKMEISGFGKIHDNNEHLASKRRREVPNGITYCEGVLSNSKDWILKKEFWWCNGLPCLEHCETKHAPTDWADYTLLDFLNILNINCDEIDYNGRNIPNGKYYKFISTINRFNELLDRLYCKDCDHILHPLEIGNFGARNVTRFHCVNEKCVNKEVVYLNNCLNGRCKNIIDSRMSQTCPNGLYICDKCGVCCSHSQMNRRLDNLKLTGGSISKSLQTSIAKKLGHLERKVFFCYKCGDNMIEEDKRTKKFKCKNCKIQYDLKPYGFKFPHADLPKEPTDVFQNKKSQEDPNDEDLPF